MVGLKQAVLTCLNQAQLVSNAYTTTSSQQACSARGR